MDSDREVAERRLGHTVGGKWRLERLLGTGGMAAVYAAVAPDGSRAALKLLHPEMTLKRDVRERFVREAYVSNKVQHPGAVQIIEHGDSEGEAYLVMELLDGEPLGERVRRLDGLPPEELFGYLDQVLDVLVAAHAQGIIHRDIKPDNLFVLRDGRVKILDFGLARMLDEVPGEYKTRTGLALGTLPYMAPEQALGKRGEVDGRVDVFALGATAFRILARRRVHEADSEAELLVAMATKPVPPLSSVAAEMPTRVCAVIDMSLAFSKDARYPDARTMQADVRAVLAGKDPPHAIGKNAHRDMPTRIDRVAPVVDAPPAPSEQSAISMPSVPHVIAAGARAASTALMPVVPDPQLANEPTRIDSPAAALTHGPTLPDPIPASVAPNSVSPMSGGYPPTAYAVAPPQATSSPPPAKRSALPVLLLVLGALFVVGLIGIAVVVLAGGLLSPAETGAAGAPAVAAPAASETNTASGGTAETASPPSTDDTSGAPPGTSTAGKPTTATQSTAKTAAPLAATSTAKAPSPTSTGTGQPAATSTAPSSGTTPAPTGTTAPTGGSEPGAPGRGNGKAKGKDK